MKRAIALLLSLVSLLSLCACILAPSRKSSETGIKQEPSANIVDDSKKIEMLDVLGLPLYVALESLKNQGFTQITSNYDTTDTIENDRIIVTKQSMPAGTRIEADASIVLTCSLQCSLYIDVKSEYNLLFDKYDLELYLDNTEIGAVSNGNSFTKLIDVLSGSHQFYVYKSGDHSVSASRTLTIEDDTTFVATLSHGRSISFSDTSIVTGIQGASIELIDVTNMSLSDAISSLKALGFINIREEPYGDIWLKENWIVVSQSIDPGSTADKNNLIVLNCIKIDIFFRENYPGKTLAEIQAFSSANGLSLKYRNTTDGSDLDDTINALQEDNKQYWLIDKAEQWTGKTALVYLTYLGTPEERAEAEAKAAKEKADAEAKAALESKLQSYFSKEDAKKAIIVAFTNNCATDVFYADGNSFDPSKFHGYNYTGQFRQSISKDGVWSAINEKTWHVENLYLYLQSYNQSTKLSCYITFDGTNYILSHIDYMTAAPNYIDTNDKSKTSGWMHMEPDNMYPYLTLPQSLVKGTGGQNEDNAPPPPVSSSTNSDYANWIGEQFSSWDGSHRELTKLIKRKLNDEKSYKHIETDYYEMTSQEVLDTFNKILAESGYSDRLELNDLLIITKYSAKNAYNATIKATAIGISSYKTRRVKLVGIE